MVLNPQELSLNIKPIFIPKTISGFLGGLSAIRNVPDKLLELENFIKRLEDEMRKIHAFKRELPLTLLLINDAITALKEELSQCKRTNVEAVFEEFVPLKKSSDEAEKDETTKEEEEIREKKNWLSSAQLWNNTDYENTRDTDVNCNINSSSVMECVEKSEHETESLYEPCKGRAKERGFVPFEVYSGFPVAASRKLEDKEALPATGLSLVTPGISKPRVGLGSSVLSSKSSSGIAVSSSTQSNCRTSSLSSRKPRRCWSPELHRRFVGALQQLGGSQAATPKQIRELMQVDGLTNDEVKSHLQKYRIHTRRSPTNKSTESACTLGSGLWISRDGESSTQTHSKSSSPEGPLQLTSTTARTSTTVCESMEDEGVERS